jgi:hypothetical protein
MSTQLPDAHNYLAASTNHKPDKRGRKIIRQEKLRIEPDIWELTNYQLQVNYHKKLVLTQNYLTPLQKQIEYTPEEYLRTEG